MEIHPLRSGVSTSYLVVEGKRAMLVDAGEPGLTPKVLATLRDLDAELGLIVLTHFHYDHVGAADAIRAATGARVAIHEKDAEALRAGGRLQLVPTRLFARLLATFINKKEQRPVTPDLEFGDEEDLTRYGGFGKTFWTPGHTPGSQSIVLDDGTVFAGDALTEKAITHHAQGPMFIDDAASSTASIKAIAARATTLYVAHNGKVEIRSIKSFAAGLRD
ncbi:MBL fold metallo-hydrolase [Modestobacter muralis]|uniref:MBL fold metallo-hydrolase n=1 Tax=Modestobacter muralis TaxID=1608614 RepID=A0A6P0EXF1_9ACTN|nr:MBL fold metallo-hydrolase [Modestobacter muralis]NEK95256.1 MBL fold metallo-hydrolase [Modestobacter muralis]NEN52144.1 MBL fold metallo-hydrolase [Modestobacter muralis]